jgi:hypothetical protein
VGGVPHAQAAPVAPVALGVVAVSAQVSLCVSQITSTSVGNL